MQALFDLYKTHRERFCSRAANGRASGSTFDQAGASLPGVRVAN
jgi:hypothetical protein